MFKNSARLIPPCVCARALEFNALAEIDRDGGSSVPRSWFLRTATLCRPSPLRGSNVQDVWSLNQARRQLTIKSHFSFLFFSYFLIRKPYHWPDKKEEGSGQQQHITDRVYLWRLAAPGRINKKGKWHLKWIVHGYWILFAIVFTWPRRKKRSRKGQTDKKSQLDMIAANEMIEQKPLQPSRVSS